jgi:hypothetical protein
VDAVFSDNPFLLLAPGAVKPRRGVLF